MWYNAPRYDLEPKQRAKIIYNKFTWCFYDSKKRIKNSAIISQKLIIKKLENHGIISEYENEVLTEIEKL